MRALLCEISLAVLLGWIAWGVASLILGLPVSAIIGALAGALTVIFLRDTLVVRGLVALLDPVGIVLPLLILRQVAGALGLPVMPFGTGELLFFLALYIPFLACALGVWPVDPYRVGYMPAPVAGIVLVVCLYGLLVGNWFIPLIAVAGQALWVARLGSSNYFDHVLHVALIPVVCVVLILRMAGAG